MKLNPFKVFSLSVHKNNKQTNRFMIAKFIVSPVGPETHETSKVAHP